MTASRGDLTRIFYLAITGEVDGATSITMDETELATAHFVKRDKIEEDKNLLSLTATMIDRFRKGLE